MRKKILSLAAIFIALLFIEYTPVRISGNNAGIDLLGLKLSLAIPSASAENNENGISGYDPEFGLPTCSCPTQVNECTCSYR
jgi:flagellar biosynthesis component FlhA